jgi:hypothetical protein
VKLKLYERDVKVVSEVLRRLAEVHMEQTDDGRGAKLSQLGQWPRQGYAWVATRK